MVTSVLFYVFNMPTLEGSFDFSHKIYKNDPVLFKSYVNEKVDVTTKDENTYSGIVYTVDPVSESVVLLQQRERNQFSLKIVLGHAIKSIEVVAGSKTIVPDLFLSAAPKVPQSVIAERKSAVIQLLRENRFPVIEKNDTLFIEDIMSIEPPYAPENCNCTNSIVLSRIQNLLSMKRE